MDVSKYRIIKKFDRLNESPIFFKQFSRSFAIFFSLCLVLILYFTFLIDLVFKFGSSIVFLIFLLFRLISTFTFLMDIGSTLIFLQNNGWVPLYWKRALLNSLEITKVTTLIKFLSKEYFIVYQTILIESYSLSCLTRFYSDSTEHVFEK